MKINFEFEILATPCIKCLPHEVLSELSVNIHHSNLCWMGEIFCALFAVRDHRSKFVQIVVICPQLVVVEKCNGAPYPGW